MPTTRNIIVCLMNANGQFPPGETYFIPCCCAVRGPTTTMAGPREVGRAPSIQDSLACEHEHNIPGIQPNRMPKKMSPLALLIENPIQRCMWKDRGITILWKACFITTETTCTPWMTNWTQNKRIHGDDCREEQPKEWCSRSADEAIQIAPYTLERKISKDSVKTMASAEELLYCRVNELWVTQSASNPVRSTRGHG